MMGKLCKNCISICVYINHKSFENMFPNIKNRKVFEVLKSIFENNYDIGFLGYKPLTKLPGIKVLLTFRGQRSVRTLR